MQLKSDAYSLLESALARSNSTLFLRCSREGQVVVCSPALAALMATTAERLVGGNLFELLTPEESDRFRKCLEVPEYEAAICQLTLPQKEGLIFQLSVDAEGFVLLGEHPQLQAIQAAHERRHLEEAARVKSSFLANLNHEIRDPLNAVAGMVHLLENTPLNEQQYQYLKNIQGGIGGLLEVLDRVLEFSSTDLTDFELRSREFRLDALLQGLFRQVAGRAQEKEVEVLIQSDPDVPDRLQGDPVLLHQLLLALLENGVKFSAGGRVSLSVQSLEAGRLQFKVLDSGIGMTAEQLAALNDPFSALHTERLGLRRCQRLAEMLQAELKIQSQAGQGTLVTIGLTLEAPTAPPVQVRRQGGAGQKVLVVEDDSLNQRIVRELLEQAGVAVEVAGDGAQALRMLESGDWRVVLMDLEMPQLDGLETTRQIRQQARFDQVPIVATTSHVLPEQRQRCQEAGMDGFLSKPIDPAIWFERLAEWLPLTVPGNNPTFPNLTAVNTRNGLKSCGGNHSFYRSLLVDFGQRCRRSQGEIKLAHTHGDLAVLQSACHALYGLAANLGAEAVAEACQRTESLARSGNQAETLASVPAVLEALEVTAASLADELAPGPAPSFVPEGWTAESLRQAKSLILKLTRHLQSGQADALDSVQELIAGSAPLSGQLSQLEKLVNQFDFSGALAELEALSLRLPTAQTEAERPAK